MYVVKDRIWPTFGYEPHDGQREIHNDSTRHRVVAWGRRGGKSRVGGNEFIPEAVYTYSIRDVLAQADIQRIFWIVGPDYSDCEKEFRVLWNSCKKLEFPMDKPGSYNNPLGSPMQVSLFGGKFQVLTKSAKYPDGLDGEGLAGVEMVEAAKLKGHIWGKYIRPALSDHGGWSLQTSTPEGKNWFYKHWQRGQDPTKPWRSWRMPSWVNTILFPGGRNDPEIQEMREEMSEERFKQEVEADFTEFVGRVFKDFDEEIHVTDCPYDPRLAVSLAVDYGWTNPFVVLGVQEDVFQNVYVCGEYRNVNRDTNEVAADLKMIPWARAARDLYPDPAEPDDSNILANALRVKLHSNTGGELKWRLEQLRKWLKYDPESEGHADESRLPKLFIDRHCNGMPLGDGGLIREMQEYRYPETKEESQRAYAEEPMDKDNHGPEALGRYFRGRFGAPADSESDGHARIRKAVVR